MAIQKPQNNYAFIDAQNLYMGIQGLGWDLDYRRFYVYLQKKYQVKKVYLFLGFLETNEDLYSFLKEVGYILIFRKIVMVGKDKIKGNVDVDMTVKALVSVNEYDQCVIVTSDGDFYPLVEHLNQTNKLRIVLSSYRKTCSKLLKESAKEKIAFLDRLEIKLKRAQKKEDSD